MGVSRRTLQRSYRITKRVTPVDYEVWRPGQRQERKVDHINLLKKWYHNDSSTSLLALSIEDTVCQGDEELEKEYLLETSSQQELPRRATTHFTMARPSIRNREATTGVPCRGHWRHSWSHNSYGAHCGCW